MKMMSNWIGFYLIYDIFDYIICSIIKEFFIDSIIKNFDQSFFYILVNVYNEIL